MAKRKKELKPEECTTYQLRLQYSRQQWEREQNLPYWSPEIFDWPIETEEWHSPHYWLNEAMRQRAERKLAKELGLVEKRR
jgi:hypothetical protein